MRGLGRPEGLHGQMCPRPPGSPRPQLPWFTGTPSEVRHLHKWLPPGLRHRQAGAVSQQGNPSARTHCWVTVPLTPPGRALAPVQGERNTQGLPPPSPVPEMGAWLRGRERLLRKLSSGGSGPVPCSAASSGLLVSLILCQEGGGSRVATATASSSPAPITLASGYSASRGLQYHQSVFLVSSVSLLAPLGALLVSSLGTPPGLSWSQEGRVKALSRKNEAEQSEEQGQQPEQAGQRTGTKPAPSRTSCPSETARSPQTRQTG